MVRKARFIWIGVIASSWCFAVVGARQSLATQTDGAETAEQVVDGKSATDHVPPAEYSHRTPRETLRSFMVAMVRNDPQAALASLDFSEMSPEPDDSQKLEFAKMLKSCIDRMPLVDPESISNDPSGIEQPFPPDKEDAVLRIARGTDQQWRFSPGALARLPALYDLLKDKPLTGEAVSKPDMTAETGAISEDEKEAGTEESVAQPVEVPDHLGSARRVMLTLFESLDEKDYTTAVSTLDFSTMETNNTDLGPYSRLELARRLRHVIERMQSFDFGDINDDPNGPPFRFPIGEENQPILISRGDDGVWQFSSDTVDSINSLHEIYGERQVKQRPWYRRVVIMGNELWRILLLFGVIFFSMFIGRAVRMLAYGRSRTLKADNRVLMSLTLETVAKTVPVILLLLGLAVGIQNLTLGFTVKLFTGTILRVILTLITAYICFRLVDVVVGGLKELTLRSESSLNDMLVPIVSTSLRLTIIVLAMLEILTAVSDKPPSAIIAGLGAGGLAIGLAAQDTIKNFFGSVLIFADRPFEIGDRIVIDGHDGPVESVGFRSTRIRTLDGHLVTVPNGEMAAKTLQNVGKRPYIRRIINIRLAYGTGPEKVRQALEILSELLEQHEGWKESHPARVFLHDFLESAVNIRAIYWYHPPNYWDYCAFGERLNLQIMERFQDADIQFALPAQQLFVSDGTEDAE